MKSVFTTSKNDVKENLDKIGKINKLFIICINFIMILLILGYSYLNTNEKSTLLYVGFWGALGITYASCLVGVFIGFLFGIPKASLKMSEDQNAKFGLMMNSNLEQVSDWLTKLIVGAVLVDFSKLFTQIAYFATGYGTGINQNFGIGMIILAFIGGFICSYLFVAVTYSHNLNEIIQSQYTNQSVLSNLENIKTENYANTEEDKIQIGNEEDSEALLKIVDQDNNLKNYARSIVPSTFNYDSDPWKNYFGGKSNIDGISLIATVKEDSEGLFEVIITIKGSESNIIEQNSLVVFFIHPSFSRFRRYVRAKQNSASITLFSQGAFTVGALVNGGKTKLELDLSEIKNAPKRFIEN